MGVLALLALGWLLGLLLAPALPAPVALCAAAVAFIGGAIVAAYGETLTSFVWGVPLGVAALLAGLGFRAPEPAEALAPGVARLTATVESVRFRRREAIATARVEHGARIDGDVPVPPGVRLDVVGADVPEGARVRLLGRIQPAIRFRNESPHPPWPRVEDVGARVWPVDGSRVEVVAAPEIAGLVHRAQSAVRAGLDATLGDRAAGLARALVLGEGAALDDDDEAAVRDLGLTHVLAVSGLHVVVVVGLAVLALEAWLVRLRIFVDARRIAAGVGIPLALVYAELAGGAPSAIRAALTASIAYALVALGRRPSPIPALAGAVIVQSLLDPSGAHHPGFLLSVLSTAALVTAPRAAGRGVVEQLRAAAAISVRAMVATLPLVVWLFGRLPWAGVVANVLLVPIGVALVPLTLAHGLVAAAAPSLARFTAPPVEAACEAFLVACDALAFEGASAAMPPPSVAQGVVLAIACAALLFLRGRARVAAAAAFVLALAAGEVALRVVERPRDVLRATVLDVGQGDAVLVDLPDGRAMLVDTGNVAPDAGATVIAPLLAARRRDRLDVVVLTHPHPDHYGGLGHLLDAIAIGELWDSGQAEDEDPDGAASALLARARARGVRVRAPTELCDQPRRFGRARVDVLWPCPRYDIGLGPNDNSLVLRVALGRRALLLTGDLEAHGEDALVARGAALRADFLKVGHHGSRTSTTPAFVRAVAPRFAAISAGAHNRYGHPHAEPLAALRAAGAEVLRTGLHGGITVETDGRALSVTTAARASERLEDRERDHEEAREEHEHPHHPQRRDR